MSLADDRLLRDALAAHLAAQGYRRCEPPILLAASDFFDSGEDIRGRLYLTSDISGTDYCLRPEYTIPVCHHYLASDEAGKPAAYSYCGPVFRYRADGPGEFIQAGLENFGRSDKEAADAEILAICVETIASVAGKTLSVKIGDAGLFARLLEALDLSPQWRRRISRGHLQGKALEAILTAPLNGGSTDHSGVLAALEGSDKQGARALVEDLLSIAGIATIGGRTAAEIADRFLEQAALKSGTGFPAEKRAILEQFLDIESDPDHASAALRQLAIDAKLDLTAILDQFDARLGFMAMRGLDVASLRFGTGFARHLDYYTGFVFEALDKDLPDGKPLAGGGRYDLLAKSLGAKDAIPAVGAAIWVDRLETSKSGAPS
jgi:ATP phosphoribosyltransferase regulatory subunit